MTRFVIVNEPPAKLKKDELVIKEPDFIEEIKLSKNRPASRGRQLTALNHLKSICGNIGELYDKLDPENPEGFNHITGVPYARYVGIEYKDLNDLSKVVKTIFKKHHPKIFEKYLDKQIKARPARTKTIYFVGSADHAVVFLKNGLDAVLADELKTEE
jgi:hypothetical protein